MAVGGELIAASGLSPVLLLYSPRGGTDAQERRQPRTRRAGDGRGRGTEAALRLAPKARAAELMHERRQPRSHRAGELTPLAPSGAPRCPRGTDEERRQPRHRRRWRGGGTARLRRRLLPQTRAAELMQERRRLTAADRWRAGRRRSAASAGAPTENRGGTDVGAAAAANLPMAMAGRGTDSLAPAGAPTLKPARRNLM